MSDPTGPSIRHQALRNALARADAAIAEVMADGTQVDRASARQMLVQEFLREEEDRLGVPRNRTAGFMHGLADTGTGVVSGLAGLTNSETLRGVADNMKQEQEAYYNEGGDESGGMRTFGRVVGEGGLAMASGNLMARGLQAGMAGARGAQFGNWLAKAQGINQAAGTAAPGWGSIVAGNVIGAAPVDVALGAGRGIEEGIGIPKGVVRELAYDALGTGVLAGVGKGLGRLMGHGGAAAAPGPTPEAARLAEEAAAPAAPRPPLSPLGKPPDVNAIRLGRMARTGYANPDIELGMTQGTIRPPDEAFGALPRQPGDFRELGGTLTEAEARGARDPRAARAAFEQDMLDRADAADRARIRQVLDEHQVDVTEMPSNVKPEAPTPKRVLRPKSQLQDKKGPIYENPDPIAEATAARAGEAPEVTAKRTELERLEAEAAQSPQAPQVERRSAPFKMKPLSVEDFLYGRRREDVPGGWADEALPKAPQGEPPKAASPAPSPAQSEAELRARLKSVKDPAERARQFNEFKEAQQRKIEATPPKPKKAVKPKVKEAPVLKGERPFNPETDPDMLVPDPATGEAPLLRRRTADGTFVVAPNPKYTGGGPAEVPPFEKLEARRPGTPGRQASSQKPSEPSKPLSGVAKLRAERLAEAESPITKGSSSASSGSLRESPSPNLGHPSKQPNVSQGRVRGLMQAESEHLAVEGELARKTKVTTPRVAKYTSPDPGVEAAHREGLTASSPKARIEKALADFKDKFWETFRTSHHLKGKDVVGTKGESRTLWYRLAQDMRRHIPSQRLSELNEAASDLVNATAAIRDANEADIMSRAYLNAHDLEAVDKGFDVPFPITREGLLRDKEALDAILAKQPHIAKAVQNLKNLSNAMREDLVSRGFMGEGGAEWYFHNEIIDFMRSGRTSSARTPGLSMKLNRALMKKVGSLRPYDRDLIGVMTRYYTDMRTDLAEYDAVRAIANGWDFRRNPKADVAHLAETWDGKAPPPGYVFYNVKQGFPRLRGSSMMERIASEIGSNDVEAMAKHLGIDEVELRNAMEALGVPEQGLHRDIAVLPKELADELLLITNKQPKHGLIQEVSDVLGRGFKWAALNLNPVRRIYRDLTGDTERWIAQAGVGSMNDKEAWRRAWEGVTELYTKNNLVGNMGTWQRYSVLNSGRIVSEVSDVRRLAEIQRLKEAQGDAFGVALNIKDRFKRLAQLLPKAAAFREDLLRTYIAEMNYGRMLRGEKPITGIVDPAEVSALIEQSTRLTSELDLQGENPLGRAASMIARNSLIDYGDFTPAENVIRQAIVPFYAWAKKNTLFWGRDLPRAIKRGDASAGNMASALTSKAMRGLATVAAIGATVRLWNSTVMKEAEDKVPTYMRNQTHIILPDPKVFSETGQLVPWIKKDNYGNETAVTISPTTASDDFFRMVGLDGVAPEFISYMRGEIDAKDLGRYVKENMLYASDAKFKAPLPSLARAALGSLGPPSTIVQAITGTPLFPDPLNVRQLPEEDRPAALLNSLALGGAPGVEQLMNLSETALSPKQNTMFDVTRSLGVRDTPLNRESTRLTNLRRDILGEINEFEEFEKRMLRTRAGMAQRSLTQEQRDREFAHMERLRAAKMDRIKRRMETFWKLQRYEETAAH